MGNGNGVIGTFLFGPAEYIKREQSSIRTNLQNIVQNPDEWVTILEPSCHAFSSINSNEKTAYSRSTWDSYHLYLVISAIVRVVRKGFCCSTDAFEPEEFALCSEALDEYTLIRSRGWIFLAIQAKKKNQCTSNKRELGNGLGQIDCYETLRVPDCCSKQNSPCRYRAVC